jgi:hypothetical protein
MASGSHPYDPLGFQELQPGISKDAKEFFDKRAGEEYKLSAAIARVFDTDDGKMLAEWMQSILRSPTWMSSIARGPGGMDAACAHGFAREGQNSLIEEILGRAKTAKECKNPEDYARLLSNMKGQNYDSI